MKLAKIFGQGPSGAFSTLVRDSFEKTGTIPEGFPKRPRRNFKTSGNLRQNPAKPGTTLAIRVFHVILHQLPIPISLFKAACEHF